MWARRISRASGLAVFVSLVLAAQAGWAARQLDGERISTLTGAKGSWEKSEEGVYKVQVPRTDLSVRVGGVKLTPPQGLTSWAAFKQTGGAAMVMGDLVLTEGQVNPVMSVALQNGLEVTALHNHFAFESPRIMFMHIGGMGGEDELGRAVGKVFAKMRETSREGAPRVTINPAQTTLSPDKNRGRPRPQSTILGANYPGTAPVKQTGKQHVVSTGITTSSGRGPLARLSRAHMRLMAESEPSKPSSSRRSRS